MIEQAKEIRFKLHTNIDTMPAGVRLMILVVGLLVIYLIWKASFWDPIKRQHRNIRVNSGNIQKQIDVLDSQIKGIEADIKVDPTIPLRVELHKIEAEVLEIDKKIAQYSGNLITPQAMVATFKEILDRNQGLLIKQTRSTGAEPLLPAKRNSIQLYRHGLIIKFDGTFFDTLEYLKELENLQSRILWDSLAYAVTEYPVANVEIFVHTLSYDKDWIAF